jgi:hypothetical protein
MVKTPKPISMAILDLKNYHPPRWEPRQAISGARTPRGSYQCNAHLMKPRNEALMEKGNAPMNQPNHDFSKFADEEPEFLIMRKPNAPNEELELSPHLPGGKFPSS